MIAGWLYGCQLAPDALMAVDVRPVSSSPMSSLPLTPGDSYPGADVVGRVALAVGTVGGASMGGPVAEALELIPAAGANSTPGLDL